MSGFIKHILSFPSRIVSKKARLLVILGAGLSVSLFLIFFGLPDAWKQQLTPSKSIPVNGVQAAKHFTGTQQELTVYTITGQEKGPILLIIGGIHGDESGGYLTAERYRDVVLKKGTLIIVPRLNAVAIAHKSRNGLSGNMNRLFDHPENSTSNPDMKVVDLARSLIRQADYVLNLHQGSGFYARRWVSYKRNPMRWGQCNVIDIPIFHLPNGYKLEVGNYAQRVVKRTNAGIKDKNYHFEVNNTDTAGKKSRHKEQKGSLTYYALYKQHKIALGMEATNNCTLSQAVSFLTIAVNAAITEAGLQAEKLPAIEQPKLTLAYP